MQDGEGSSSSRLSSAISESQEKKIVLLLCVLAAIHVFIFSAAFPFFNNVDEPAHFDSVLQYSHGQVPRRVEHTSKEASVYLALFCSCAYLGPSYGPVPPPPWAEPVEKMKQDLAVNSAGWQTQEDYEASEPPLYYALAGLWWDTGKLLGFTGEHLLYWLRFFSLLPVVALVWLGYYAAALCFPENVFVRLGVACLLAFMPQTAFYSIGNDVFSPLCFGMVFICLVQWLEKPTLPLGATLGIAFGVTYLTKATNLPLLAVVAAVIAIKSWHKVKEGKSREILPSLAGFLVCATPLIIAWMLWCKFNFGDLTGSKVKVEHLGWTIKPFSQWWYHPIFSPSGIWTYLSGELGTFWQGEFYWYYPPTARPLALPGTRIIYTILSLVLPGLALSAMFSQPSRLTPLQRRALQLSFICVASVLVFFAMASIAYDFHNSTNPSRLHPYFQAGRMMLGMLIPFLLLFVYGLDWVLGRFGNSAKFIILGTMVLSMLAVEIAADWPVFANAYNWFHLP